MRKLIYMVAGAVLGLILGSKLSPIFHPNEWSTALGAILGFILSIAIESATNPNHRENSR
jgi:F0F1-type ATP synthase assembly protein I